MILCISFVDIVLILVVIVNVVISGVNINQVVSVNGIYGSKGNDLVKCVYFKQLK